MIGADSARVVLLLQVLQALDRILRRGVFQCGEHPGLFLLGKAQDGAVIAHAALPGTGGGQLPAGVLAQEILEVDHGHILAQQLNGLGEHLLAGVHVFHIQQVHRVQQDLQVGAADLVQHGAGTFGVVHDVLDHRLDGNGHTVLLGAAHHRFEVLDHIPVLDTVYTDNVTFEMIVPVEEVGSVEKKFMEASMGKAVLKKGEETYYAEIDGKISYDL